MFVIALLFASSANGASAIEVSDCANAERDRLYHKGIALCSRLLAEKKLGASDQAFVRTRRGEMYRLTGKLDEAIADFDAVVQFKPKFADDWKSIRATRIRFMAGVSPS
jgi:hypothetical protein